MNEQLKAKWNRMKRMGRSNYLIRYGIVPWSFGLTLFFGAVELLTQGQVIWVWLPIRLIVFAVVGFFIANTRWQSMEKRMQASQPALNKRP